MKRVSLVMTIVALMLIALFTGCEEETASAEETGIRTVFEDCVTFGVYIFIEGELQTEVSTDEPQFIPLPAGTYHFYGISNASIGGNFFCWSREITVSDGNMQDILLSCSGAECTP